MPSNKGSQGSLNSVLGAKTVCSTNHTALYLCPRKKHSAGEYYYYHYYYYYYYYYYY